MLLMKIFISTIALLLMFFGCKKYEKPTDEIINHSYNKTLTGFSKDSINIACYCTVFAIEHINGTLPNDTVNVFLKYPINMIIGDCGIQYMLNKNDNNVNILSDNDIISDQQRWSDSYSASSLSGYRGKGSKYIGFRCSTITADGVYYRYGWLKIEINAIGNTLKIYSWATNNTINRAILAGQTY